MKLLKNDLMSAEAPADTASAGECCSHFTLQNYFAAVETPDQHKKGNCRYFGVRAYT
jgi:hypothetical protein